MFDISSLYGELQPGDTKLVTFSFLGHADISTHVLALCEVEGGPTYEITLKGQASFVSYTLDTNDIDFGLQVTTHFHHYRIRMNSAEICVNGRFCSVLQLFDHVAEAELILKNTGKVGFDFSSLTGETGLFLEQLLPGQPLIIPSKVRCSSCFKTLTTFLPIKFVAQVHHVSWLCFF